MDDTTSHDRADDSGRLQGVRDELVGQIRDRAGWSSGLQAVADELEQIEETGDLEAVFAFLLGNPDRRGPWR
jgi:hypothetical protein